MTLLIPLVLAVSGVETAAHTAQAPDSPERQAAARALFEEGLRNLQVEEWADAADRFERAYALRPSPEIGYNLSSALLRLGRLVRASELLRQVVQSPQATDKVRTAADTRLQQILPRIARLTVRLEGEASDGVVVRLDDQTLDPAMLGVAIPVDPGSHRVDTVRAGAVSSTRTISVGEGGAVALKLDAPAVGASRAPVPAMAAPGLVTAAPAAGEDTSRGSRWWLWTAIGVAAAAVVVGVAVAARPGTASPEKGSVGTLYIGKGP